MKKHDRVILHKIERYCKKVEDTLLGVDRKTFEEDYKVHDLCSFYLFQIGELSNKLSEDLKKQYSNVDWKGAYWLRNFIGHDYENISLGRLWKTCKNDIPKLFDYANKIISDIEEPQQQTHSHQPKEDQGNRSDNDEGDFLMQKNRSENKNKSKNKSKNSINPEVRAPSPREPPSAINPKSAKPAKSAKPTKPTKPTIITFSGKAQHGKDASLEILKHHLEENGKTVMAIGYADYLKEMAAANFGWDGKKDERGRSLLQNVGEAYRGKDPNF